jgi:hypothetical protein
VTGSVSISQIQSVFKLTTEELQDVHMEQQQEVAEELSSEEEKVDSKGSIPTADIKEHRAL